MQIRFFFINTVIIPLGFIPAGNRGPSSAKDGNRCILMTQAGIAPLVYFLLPAFPLKVSPGIKPKTFSNLHLLFLRRNSALGGDVEKYHILFWLKCSIGLCFVQFFFPLNRNLILSLASAETNPVLRYSAAFLSLPWLTAFMVTSARIKIICASWCMSVFEHGCSLSYISGFYWRSKLH